jgi:hypothetical protein
MALLAGVAPARGAAPEVAPGGDGVDDGGDGVDDGGDAGGPEERAALLEKAVAATLRSADSEPSVLDGVDPARASPDVLRVVNALRSTLVDVAFENQDVDGCLAIIRQASGLPLVVSKKARESLAEEKPEVTLTLERLPLENVLNLLALQLGEYRFTIRYGAVVLVRKDEHRPKPILRVYDVADIVRKPPDFPAPPLALDEQVGKQR